MNLVYEARASTILYNLIRSGGTQRPWILPANVCSIVPLTYLKAGCPFELVDIDESTLCLDRDEVLRRLDQAPRAYGGVLFVRTFGIEDDFSSLFGEIKSLAASLILVDDRCLCRPRFELPPERTVDVALYSTGYAKPVDVGFGGFAYVGTEVSYNRHRLPFDERDLERVTADVKCAIEAGQRLDYRDAAWLDTREPETAVHEYRMLIEQRTREAYDLKRRINAIYRGAIPSTARLDDRFQSWRFHVLVDRKQELIGTIFDHGLFASSHYADLTPLFTGGRAPVAERLHGRLVNLFNDRYFSEEKAERVAMLVRDHLQKG